MTFRVFYNGEQYELPDSMGCLNKYQDDSMKRFDGGWTDILTLSHLEIVNILTDENPNSGYKLFVGVMPTIKHDTIIIIYGEYFENSPYDYGSFHYIEVGESEMIEFNDQPSKFILDVGNNSYAILLKSELIVIGITPDFQDFLQEEVDDEYSEAYLSIKRIDFIRGITDFTLDRSSIDGRPSFDEHMTTIIEKDDDGCEISLCFTCVCSYSKIIHSETMNKITISFSNEQIRITYAMNTTTYERYIADETGYNDYPTMRTDERNATFYHGTIINLVSEEDY
jgi:hypothetical protein